MGRELEHARALDVPLDDGWGLREQARRRRVKRRAHAERHARRRLEFELLRLRPGAIDAFLYQYVGWLWDDVYASLCRRFTRPYFRHSLLGSRLGVARKVALIDEKPHPLPGVSGGRFTYYVCPLTGRFKTGVPGVNAARRQRAPRAASHRIVDERVHLRRLSQAGQPGARWYEVTLAPLPERAWWGQTRDVVLGEGLDSIDRRHCVPWTLRDAHHAKRVYASAVRLLTPHERYERGLTDEAPLDPGHKGCRHIEHARQGALRRRGG